MLEEGERPSGRRHDHPRENAGGHHGPPRPKIQNRLATKSNTRPDRGPRTQLDGIREIVAFCRDRFLAFRAMAVRWAPRMLHPRQVRGPRIPSPHLVVGPVIKLGKVPPAPHFRPKVTPLDEGYLHSLLNRAFYVVDSLPVPLHRDDLFWLEDVRGHLMAQAMKLHQLDPSQRAMIPKEKVKLCQLAEKYAEFLRHGQKL